MSMHTRMEDKNV